MIRKTLFVILTMLSLSFTPHEYYVTVTNAEYNSTEHTFQLTIKFIGHDLEKALSTAGLPDLFLGTPKEKENANQYILDYINKRLRFKTNDKYLEFNMVGKEVGNDDFIYCYIESEKVKKLKILEIENTLLTEVFPKQENILYLVIEGKKSSFSFRKDVTKQTLNLE